MSDRFSFRYQGTTLFDTTYEFRDVGQKDTVLHALDKLLGTEIQAVRSFVSVAVPFSAEHAATWLRDQKPDVPRIDLFERACSKLNTSFLPAIHSTPIPRPIFPDAYIIFVGDKTLCDYPLKLNGVIELTVLTEILQESTSLKIRCVPLRGNGGRSKSLQLQAVIDWMLQDRRSKESVLRRLLDKRSNPDTLSQLGFKCDEVIEAVQIVPKKPQLDADMALFEINRERLEVWGRKTGSDGIPLPDERKAAIQKIIEERGIEVLTHFTQLNNLDSILRDGLKGRSSIFGSANFNDHKRLDDRLDAICLSVSFPNFALLNKFKRMVEFAIILIDPSIMWQLDCGFTSCNAASSRSSGLDSSTIRQVSALESMFNSPELREMRGLEHCEATDNQSEVLAFETVPAHYIKAIHFENESKGNQQYISIVRRANHQAKIDKTYFGWKEAWRQEKI